MEFHGLDAIGTEPQIEIRRNDEVWDLHNAADFIGHEYDPNAGALVLSWVYGCDCEGIVGGEISLVFRDVMDWGVSELDPNVPRSEDLCLEEMRLYAPDTISLAFRGGRRFRVSCGTVVFNSNKTTGHRGR